MNGDTVYPQINVYRQSENPQLLGWIILVSVLTLAIIVLLILWVMSAQNCTATSSRSCFGTFGVQFGVDANPLNSCGTSQTDPCMFAKKSLIDCQTQCNNLQNICQAFTFNSSTSTMKIVRPINTFNSAQSNLFVRQAGLVS